MDFGKKDEGRVLVFLKPWKVIFPISVDTVCQFVSEISDSQMGLFLHVNDNACHIEIVASKCF